MQSPHQNQTKVKSQIYHLPPSLPPSVSLCINSPRLHHSHITGHWSFRERKCVEYSPTWITMSTESVGTFSKFYSMAYGVWSTEATIPPEFRSILPFLLMFLASPTAPSFFAKKGTSNRLLNQSMKVQWSCSSLFLIILPVSLCNYYFFFLANATN